MRDWRTVQSGQQDARTRASAPSERQFTEAEIRAYARDRVQDLLAFISDRHAKVATVEPRHASAVPFGMKQPPVNDPAYWRERALEARRIAGQLADVVAKQTMLDIAHSYETLAKIAEARPTTERST